MLRLGKRDAMRIVCGRNRLRLYKYELRPDFESCAEFIKKSQINYLVAHQKRCGRIIKLFVKAAS